MGDGVHEGIEFTEGKDTLLRRSYDGTTRVLVRKEKLMGESTGTEFVTVVGYSLTRRLHYLNP